MLPGFDGLPPPPATSRGCRPRGLGRLSFWRRLRRESSKRAWLMAHRWIPRSPMFITTNQASSSSLPTPSTIPCSWASVFGTRQRLNNHKGVPHGRCYTRGPSRCIGEGLALPGSLLSCPWSWSQQLLPGLPHLLGSHLGCGHPGKPLLVWWPAGLSLMEEGITVDSTITSTVCAHRCPPVLSQQRLGKG